MKTLLILGAGTGGTMVANKMSRLLDPTHWRIVIVDPDEAHYYQPGFLFIPFNIYKPTDVVKSKRNFLPSSVEFIFSEVEVIEPQASRAKLANGQTITYDELVVATGTQIHPEETPGLLNADGWQRNIFDFYTLTGATALGKFLSTWKGGRLVVNVAEMPIKCPVAPLEFLFLADWFFHQRKMRNGVELIYATPLSGAFTKPRATAVLGDLLQRKGIQVVSDYNIGEVNTARQVIRSYDEREIDYDLLVTIPTHMGAQVIERSEMGNELNFVPTDKHTLQSKQWDNIWVIGDAADVPTSKAGSVAHFMLDTLSVNIVRHSNGQPPEPTFDGHANCFIESGFDRGFLIDFNYDVEPLPGKYPLPGIGPFDLLAESALNHNGKLAFRWVYWNLLLKAHPLPVPTRMSMVGKRTELVSISQN
jgi:sulfide:quinone oxidoreductase